VKLNSEERKMAKTILPEIIRLDIRELLQKGYTQEAVLKFVKNESEGYVDSEKQLNRCISQIARSVKNIPTSLIGYPVSPKPIAFDPQKYSDRVAGISKNTSHETIDQIGVEVAKKFLKNELDFTEVKDGPNFVGTPFDLFGCLNRCPYMIELKTSREGFHYPGEIQKQRMRELLKKINGLHVALLQINLSGGEYRIYYDNQMDLLFYGDKKPFDKIEDWITGKMKAKCYSSKNYTMPGR
jgi:hypothetical protein